MPRVHLSVLQFLPTKSFFQWPTHEIWKWFINVFWLAWWSPGLNKGQCNYVHDTSSPRYTKNERKKGRSPRLLLLQCLRYLYLSLFLRLLRRLLLSSSDRRSHTGGVACVQAPAGRTWLESRCQAAGGGREGSRDAPACHQGRSSRFTL